MATRNAVTLRAQSARPESPLERVTLAVSGDRELETHMKMARWLRRKFASLLPDPMFVRAQFFWTHGYLPNLRDPKTFSEKIQWIKLNCRDELLHTCVDKYAVREFVRQRVGERYLNELYGVYESVDEIRFEDLPDSFALKVTHGSGGNIICKSKRNLDWADAARKLKIWLATDYYARDKEWAYKGVNARVVCERYLSDEHGNPPCDYKFFCFAGAPRAVQVDLDRFQHHTRLLYTPDWDRIPVQLLYPVPEHDVSRPENLDEMLRVASSLAAGFPFVRVDLYSVKGESVFGELTFTPGSGMEPFSPRQYDEEFGTWLRLPGF